MFGRSKPVVLESYGHRRKRGRPPRWLVLLLSGVAVGVAGVLVVQERYLPPRLSASDSAQLRQSYETADADRKRLQASLTDTQSQLATAQGEKKQLGDQLASSRSEVERLRTDLATAVASLPPDPRGGAVEVRAGRFSVEGGALVYDVVLARDRPGKPLSAVVQFHVAGTPANGPETSIALKPIQVSITGHEVVRGKEPLPAGFKARETRIQVLDRAGGRSLGMRVMLVK